MSTFNLNNFSSETSHKSSNLPVAGNKGDPKVVSNITLNWEGVTTEQVQELAALQVKTRIQNERRVNNLPIEDGEVINVTDYCLHQGRKVKPVSLENMCKEFSIEQIEAFIAAKKRAV